MAQYPAGLVEYRRALSLEPKAAPATSGARRDHDAGIDPKLTNDERPRFNSRFEDVRETWIDGEVLAVTRTQGPYGRTQQNKKRFGEYSLLLRRIVDLNNKRKPVVQLELQFDILRREFRRLCRGRVTTISLSQNPIVIQEPYAELYHLRKSIDLAAREETTPDEVRRELQLLQSFQERYMMETIITIDAFKRSSTIDFAWLWSLFGPGCQVVIQNSSATTSPVEWCTTVRPFETQKNRTGLGGRSVWILAVDHTAFNGQRFGTGQSVLTLPEFSGTIPINQLPAYPLEYHDKKEDLLQDAVGDGEKYEQYCRSSARDSSPPVGTTRMYKGPFWTLRGDSECNTRGCRLYDSPSSAVSCSPLMVFLIIRLISTFSC